METSGWIVAGGLGVVYDLIALHSSPECVIPERVIPERVIPGAGLRGARPRAREPGTGAGQLPEGTAKINRPALVCRTLVTWTSTS